MKKYLRALYESFGSFRLYYQAIHQWLGAGMLYLLTLSLLISVILCLRVSVGLTHFNEAELPFILKQWPAITLENGEITTDAKQPLKVTAKNGDTLLILDTENSMSDLRQKKAVIIVGRNFILTQDRNEEYESHDLSNYKERKIIFDRDSVEKFFDLLPLICLGFVPFIWIGQWLVLIALAIGAATLSYLVTAYMKEEFDFETRMRIGALAITPPVLINQMIESFSSYSLSFWNILALWAVYIYVIVIGARIYQKKLNVAAQ